jgi:hypothetical protein
MLASIGSRKIKMSLFQESRGKKNFVRSSNDRTDHPSMEITCGATPYRPAALGESISNRQSFVRLETHLK